MFNPSALLKFFQSSPQPELPTLQALLQPEHLSIVSAKCCHADSQPKDEQLALHLAQAMEHTGVQRRVHASTITATRQQLRELGSAASPEIETFKSQLSVLFQQQGLAAFPLLIVGGQIAFYGGVPSTEAIAQKLLSDDAHRRS